MNQQYPQPQHQQQYQPIDNRDAENSYVRAKMGQLEVEVEAPTPEQARLLFEDVWSERFDEARKMSQDVTRVEGFQ